MKPQSDASVSPRAVTGPVVNFDTSGMVVGCRTVRDAVTGTNYILPSVDAVEWTSRDPSRYSYQSWS
jgi:hypothetical protein